MQRFKCHKEVEAFTIEEIVPLPDGRTRLIGLGDDADVIVDEKTYRKKHNPQIGGYYILYKDGYASYSPAEPFEAGYDLIDDADWVAEEPVDECDGCVGECGECETPVEVEVIEE